MIAGSRNHSSASVRSRRGMRSVFISDTHMGHPHARTDRLLRFLSQIQPENLYLVGDFIDGWELCRRWSWNSENTKILDRLRELAQQGCNIRYAIGNHDDFLRSHPVAQEMVRSSGVEVANEFIHQTDDGRRFLVVHGDAFDRYAESSVIFEWATTQAYHLLLASDGVWERLFGGSSGAVSGRIKRSFQSVARHVAEFRRLLCDHARRRHFDGVICGHIHAPEQSTVSGVEYCNTGDWLESCTAIVESYCGDMTLMRVSSERQREPPLEAVSTTDTMVLSSTTDTAPLSVRQ